MSAKMINVQSLNALFGLLNEHPSNTLWIRSGDMQRQLYVNDNYESTWRRQSNELYEHPNTLIETLHPTDRHAIEQQLEKKKQHHLEADNVFHYRIITPDGEVRFIKDSHYLLTDRDDLLIGFAGFAQNVSATEWESHTKQPRRKKQADPQEQLTQYVFGILQKEMKIKTKQLNDDPNKLHKLRYLNVVDDKNQPIKLTSREHQVIVYLQQGLSAKQTASEMNISTRTVEAHLNNIKDKANCRTKIELLCKIRS